MSGQSRFAGSPLLPDAKRRKLEGEATEPSQTKSDKTASGVDRAKANYLSGQLRLRLQYAKLKVEHGWQRQSLSEVENLYFRHTHLTRPYPVISPGGRRNGRISSAHGAAASVHQQSLSAATVQHTTVTAMHNSCTASSGPNVRVNGSLGSASSTSSVDTSPDPPNPSTPIAGAGSTATPHAPHIGFNAVTRYPISRSDSTATVIIDSTPSLTQSHVPEHSRLPPPQAQHTAPNSVSSSSPFTINMPSGDTPGSSLREPFDPMQPTEHIDSRLAALRSMMTTSSMPMPPPHSHTAAMTSSTSSSTTSIGASSSGLTYDAFWSSHSSATSAYRTLLASQAGIITTAGQRPTSMPLQSHSSAPAVLSPHSPPAT
ncbi:hypothetical protein BD414DRAFT_498202 [Trametes punicea]|nr:hypothetical protein BD414DRAFT_498202 [Trametes punicea]